MSSIIFLNRWRFKMKKTMLGTFLITAAAMLSMPQLAQANETVFRRSNFSNEFKISTPEGINARGFAEVESKDSKHYVEIHAHGLLPGATYVILNHWFEPVSERGVPNSDDGPEDDPSCTGHFQFLGEPVKADSKGKIKVSVTVEQLAPHIWVANFATFLEVTKNGTQAPANADAFTTGGLMIPYADIIELEEQFIDTDPLTMCEKEPS
jgi:hypothetical protein